ncbi:MAG: hypothetical protein EOP07_07565 [Proteobacteria bacterium]|nr:MAG: hypothetical protein EOP07_07565 [Pseudomonadota bacterium]
MIKIIAGLAAVGLMGTAAHAEEVFTVRAKAISSNSNFKANSVTVQGAGAGSRQLENSDSKVNAMGYGADFDFRIAEYGHLGAEINYTDYFNDNEKVSYRDLYPAVYGAVDFLKDTNYSVFAKAGVSYHKLELKDTNLGAVTVTYDDLDIWNYDAGLGVSSKLTKDTSIGLEYRYTGSFTAQSTALEYSGFGLAATPDRLRDIKLMKNEVTASIGMML